MIASNETLPLAANDSPATATADDAQTAAALLLPFLCDDNGRGVEAPTIVEVRRRTSPHDFDQLRQRFIAWLALRRSPATVTSYDSDLRSFCEFARERGMRTVADVNYSGIEQYLIWLRTTRNNKPASVNHRLMALRAFWRWMRRNEITKSTAPDDCETLPKAKRLPRYLSIQETNKLLKGLAKRTGLIARRDEAIVATVCLTGLRVSELAALQLNDVDLSSGRLRAKGKGNKERESPITPELTRILRAYLKRTRPQLLLPPAITPAEAKVRAAVAKKGGNVAAAARHLEKGLSVVARQNKSALRKAQTKREADSSPWFFVSTRPTKNPTGAKSAPRPYGAPLCRHAINRLMRLTCSAIVGRHIHPHLCRHTYASRLRRRGADLLLLKEALGHASVQSTEIYSHLASDERCRIIKRLLRK